MKAVKNFFPKWTTHPSFYHQRRGVQFPDFGDAKERCNAIFSVYRPEEIHEIGNECRKFFATSACQFSSEKRREETCTSSLLPSAIFISYYLIGCVHAEKIKIIGMKSLSCQVVLCLFALNFISSSCFARSWQGKRVLVLLDDLSLIHSHSTFFTHLKGNLPVF
jgi:hypothetical protein